MCEDLDRPLRRGRRHRSGRPFVAAAHDATRTSVEVEQKVLAARAAHRDGPDVLGPKVGVPARTVSWILRRHGMPYLRELDPITGDLIRSSKQTAVRYERDRPGELVHMDVKKIGRIPDGGGWRVHGRGSESIQRDTASSRNSSDLTAPGETPKSSASVGPCPPSGPTGKSSPPTPTEPPKNTCRAGCWRRSPVTAPVGAPRREVLRRRGPW